MMNKQNHTFKSIETRLAEYINNGNITTSYGENTDIINIEYDSVIVEVVQGTDTDIEIITYVEDTVSSMFGSDADIIARNVYNQLNKYVKEI
jgi:hypothetical protein